MNKYETPLADAIMRRCNEFACVSQLHVANVAYAPSKWYFEHKGHPELWKVKSKGTLLLSNCITVYLKDDLKDDQIAVTYMEEPHDEMLRKEVAYDAFIDIEGERFLKSDIMHYFATNGGDSIKLYFKNSFNCSTIHATKERVIELLDKLDTIYKTVKL